MERFSSKDIWKGCKRLYQCQASTLVLIGQEMTILLAAARGKFLSALLGTLGVDQAWCNCNIDSFFDHQSPALFSKCSACHSLLPSVNEDINSLV